MSLVTVGDLHLQSDRPWGLEVGEETVKWIIENEHNDPKNTLVLLGDLTEKSVLTGSVYTLLMKLFTGLKYKKTYILVGNHDGKMGSRGADVVYDFLKDPEIKSKLSTNIEVIHEVKNLLIDNAYNCLFLPHIFPDGTHSNKDYANLPAEFKDKQYDIVFGHFTNTSVTYMGEKIDVSYLKSLCWAFGHIHNPSEQYLGSLVPNSIAEAQQIRQIRVYEATPSGVRQTIEHLDRNICDYYTVNFPDPLPATTAIIPIFTVTNCKDISVARQQYGEIYIRKVVYDISMDSEAFSAMSDSLKGKAEINISKMFDEYVEGAKLKPNITELARSYLNAYIAK